MFGFFSFLELFWCLLGVWGGWFWVSLSFSLMFVWVFCAFLGWVSCFGFGSAGFLLFRCFFGVLVMFVYWCDVFWYFWWCFSCLMLFVFVLMVCQLGQRVFSVFHYLFSFWGGCLVPRLQEAPEASLTQIISANPNGDLATSRIPTLTEGLS